MNEDVILKFKNVCFAYDREEVLHNVDLTVPRGSLAAMVGPNGGGKSTLIKLILGLLMPQRGHIHVLGTTPQEARRRIGYVAQHLQFDHRFPVSALDVVLMGRSERHVFGGYRKDDRKAAVKALEQVNLEGMASRAFPHLSGGERQRVLIAQALVTDPELLLLDEPTANVDSVVETRIYDLLKELNQQITIMVVSHNLNVVTRHASHLVCVNRTASIMPMQALTDVKLHAVHRGDMAVLQHQESCQVLDPTSALREPHRESRIKGGS